MWDQQRRTEVSPRLKARILGALYLYVIVAGAFAELFVRERLLVGGDPSATAHSILAHEQLFRLGFAVSASAAVCTVVQAVLFYDLFEVVNRSFAWLVVFFTLVGTAVDAVILLIYFAPLVVLQSGGHSSAFSAGQLQALAYLSQDLYAIGFQLSFVFFGPYCLALGYLVLRSAFLPRILGVLLGIGGLCYLTYSFASFLAPAFAAGLVPYIQLPSLVGEGSICLWLLVAGVNAARWEEQATAAAEPAQRVPAMASA